MNIVWFDQIADSDRIGSKGFRLCRLAQAGMPVPPGFCVPPEELDEMDRITPADIQCAVRVLDATAVAVRSSAIEEDTVVASFAGVYLTRLNVKTAEGIHQALCDIRASAFSPAALAYRQKFGLNSPPRMAAVIQKFVVADVSGVLFQRDPVDHSERIIIECAWGLGESVVSGTVTPDRWILSRDGAVISSEISDKDVAVIAADMGTKTVATEAGRRKAPCIENSAICELVNLARACEKLFGSPQDIEWAIAANQIWLLQSRPITCRGKMGS